MVERPRPEIELLPGALALADLHLDPNTAPEATSFASYLEALDVPQLLILGDLFDAWVGPAHESSPGGAIVCAALRASVRRGTRVDLLHGNRDFLLGTSIERSTGARVHPEGCVGLTVKGERVLFLHGDELCTRDRAYQRLRRVTHSAPLQWIGPRVPFVLSRRLAALMRRTSVQAVAAKPSEEKAMQLDTAQRLAGLHECTTLVVGHAHSARDEDHRGLRWIVLDAYGGARDALRVGPEGTLELVSAR